MKETVRFIVMCLTILAAIWLGGCQHTFHGIGEVLEGAGTDIKIMSNVEN